MDNKGVKWGKMLKSPIVILSLLILVMAIGTIVVYFIQYDGNIPPQENMQNVQNEEPTPAPGEEGDSTVRNIEIGSLLPSTSFRVQNQGALIAFLDTWGVYNDSDSINISIATKEILEERGINTDNLSSTHFTEHEGTDYYFVLLDEFSMEDENLEDKVLATFLELVYEVNVRPEGEDITKQNFVGLGLNQLRDESRFIIE